MNHIYKAVFNKATGTFAAVAEYAKGQGKRSNRSVSHPKATSQFTSNFSELKFLKLSVMTVGILSGLGISSAAMAAGTNKDIKCLADTGTANSKEHVLTQDADYQTDNDYTWLRSEVACGEGAQALMWNAVAIGTLAHVYTEPRIRGGNQVTNDGGVAIGNEALAIGDNSTVSDGLGYTPTAIGAHSDAYGDGTVAFGESAKATGKGAVSLGAGSVTDRQATIIASNATPDAVTSSTPTQDTTSTYSVDYETRAYDASQPNGYVTTTTTYSKDLAGYSTVYAADAANTADRQAIADTVKGDFGPLSIGSDDYTRQIINVAAGSADSDAVNVAQLKAVANAAAAADRETYFHVNSTGTAQTPNGTNLGKLDEPAGAGGINAIASGVNATAIDDNSIAMGTGTTVNGDNSIAIGKDAKTELVNTSLNISDAVAIGSASEVNGRRAVALGFDAHSSAYDAVAVGANTKAFGTRSVALGKNAEATGNDAIAQGSYTEAKGIRSVAIGGGTSNSTGGTTVNTGAKSLSKFSVAIGSGDNTETGARAESNKSIAIGNKSVASQEGGVALGASSIADRAALTTPISTSSTTSDTPTDTVYAAGFASDVDKDAVAATVKGSYGAVSVGDASNTRQIMNVAAGSSDTDAVNVAQLKAGQTHYFSVNDGGTNQGNFNNDAANGYNGAIAIGPDVSVADENSIVVGNNASSNLNHPNDTRTGDLVIGANASSSVTYFWKANDVPPEYSSPNVVLGNEATTNSPGGGAVVIGDQANNETFSGIAIGNNATVSGEDGPNTFGPKKTGVQGGGIAIGAFAKSYYTGETKPDGSNATPVAIGALAQATADGAVAFGEGTSSTETRSVAIGSKANASVDYGVALGGLSIADREGLSGTITTSNDANLANNEVYALAISSDADKALIAETVQSDVDIAGTTFKLGAVSVGSGTNTRQITNVAAGSLDSDAVNVAQLKSVANVAAAADRDTYFHVNPSINPATPVPSNLGKADETAGASGADGSLAAGVNTQATGPSSTAIGYNTTASGDSSVAIGKTTIASFLRAVAIGEGAESTNDASVAIGSDAKSTSTGSVAIGNNSEAINSTSVTAVGNGAKATAASATSLGASSEANGNRSTSVGASSEANGGYSSAIGTGNKAISGYSTAVGSGNTVAATGLASTAVGKSNNITGAASAAVGRDNTIAQKGTMVLGNYVVTTQANSVVLGNLSTDRAATAESHGTITTTDITDGNGNTDITYGDFAGVGSAKTGIVSVGSVDGERQLINVAAGKVSADSTDAINGSQLYSVAKTLTDTGININADVDGTAPNETAPDNVNLSETINFTADDDNIVTTVRNNEVGFKLENSITVGDTTANNSSPITIDGDAGTISGLENTLPDATTTTVNTQAPTINDESTAATVGDVLNAGFNLKNNDNAKDFVQAYDTVDFIDGTGTKAVVETTDTTSTVTYNVLTDDTLTVNGDNEISVNTGSIIPDANNPDIVSTPNDNAIATTGDVVDAVNNSGFTATAGAIGSGTMTGNVADERITNGDRVTLRAGDNMVLDQNGSVFTYSVTDTPVFDTVTATDSVVIGDTAGDNTVLTSTADGLDVGGDKITNIADGVNDSDAVNVSQLNAVDRDTYFHVNESGTAAATIAADNKGKLDDTAGAQGGNSVAAGVNAQATNSKSVAIGYGAEATGEDGYALGSGSEAKGENSVALGTGSEATKLETIAIGNNTTASGAQSITIGSDVTTGGSYGIAIGSNAQNRPTSSSGYSGVAIGSGGGNTGAMANGESSVAIGGGNKSGTGLDGAVASEKNSVALGAGSKAEIASSVALGSESVANRDVPTTGGYDALTDSSSTQTDPTWQATSAALSIGDVGNGTTRQITSVAAGSADTDAVNVAQLKSVANVANTPLSFTGNTNADTDAAGTFVAGDGTQRQLGETLNIIGSKTAVAGVTEDTSNNAITGSYSAKNIQTVITNGQVQIQLAQNPEFNSVVIGDSTNSTTLTSTADGLDVGGDKITNVAAGTDDTDAVNVSQLNTTNTNVAKGLNIAADNGTDDNVQLGETITYTSTDGNIVTTVSDNQIDYGLNNVVTVGDNTPNQITIDGDAGTVGGLTNTTYNPGAPVNGQAATEDQLEQAAAASQEEVTSDDGSITVTETIDATTKASSFDVSVNTDGTTITKDADGNLTANTTTLMPNTDGSIVTPTGGDENTLVTAGSVADAINNSGFSVQANSDAGEVINPGDAVNFIDGDNIAITRSGSDITVATKPEVSFETVTVGPVTIDDTAGIDAGDTKITGVAAGTDDTDAVNVSQLNSVVAGSKEVVESTDNSVNVTSSISSTTGATVYDVSVNTDNTTITKRADGSITANTTALTTNNDGSIATPINPDALITAGNVADAISNSGFTVKANGDAGDVINPGDSVDFVDGNNIEVSRNGSEITIGTAKDVNFDSVKVGAVTIDDTSGIDAGNTAITNVAAGVNATDAVNVSQLNSVTGTVNQGFNIAANNGADDNVQLGNTVTYTGTDDNIVTTVSDNQIGFELADQVEIGTNNPVTIDGDAGTINGLTNKTFDPNNFVSGQAATEDQLAQVVTQSNNASRGWNLTANGDASTSTAVKPTDTVDIANADDNIEISKAGNDIKVGLADDITVTTVTAGTPTSNTQLSEGGVTITGGPNDTVALTNQGLDNGNNVIRNVASGLEGKPLSQIDSNSAEWNNAATVGDLTTVDDKIGNVAQYVTNVAQQVDGVSNNVNNLNEVIGGQNIDGNVVDGQGNVITDDDGNALTVQEALTTYNVDERAEVIHNSVVSAIHNMNEEGIKFFHTNDETPSTQLPQDDYNSIDAAAGGAYSTAIGYKAEVANTATSAIAIGHEAKANGVSSISIGTGNVVNGDNSGALGDPSTINANNAYSIGNNNTIDTNADSTFVLGNEVTTDVANSVALGNKTTLTAGDQPNTVINKTDGTAGMTTTAGDKGIVNSATVNGITYEGFAGAQADGAVSVGASGSERRVQNVAAGEISPTSTDAINGSQLYMTHRAIDNLGYKLAVYVDDMEDELSAGIASSSAIENAPYVPGKWTYAAGASHFNSQSAVGISLRRTADNGRWSMNGGVSTNTENKPLFRMGISGIID